jgi:hypothetical protein
MPFEAALFSRTRFKEYPHCLKLILANSRFAPLWERICLALYISLGPALARLFGVDASSMSARADRIIADVLAITESEPEEIARHLRRYIKLRREGGDHLPFAEARAHIYEQTFYPVVTHFTYALQPSATARLNFVKEVVAAMPAPRARVADLGCGSGVILSEILLLNHSGRATAWTSALKPSLMRAAWQHTSRLMSARSLGKATSDSSHTQTNR